MTRSGTSRRRTLIGGLAASFMLLLWIVILTVAASPELHHHLHKDAQSATHTCVITQVQHQALLSGLAFLTAPVPDRIPITASLATSVFVPSTRDFRLSPSRAPPGGFSSLTVVG